MLRSTLQRGVTYHISEEDDNPDYAVYKLR